MNPENVPQDLSKQSSKPAAAPRLYRRIDWWTFALTTLLIFIGYFLTLSPDLTLEDSGELAVGSMYAGVPHPPGYPVWTLYTFLFTKLLPFSNIAWRVGVSSAVAASLACGLLALIVSRGSSMIIESLADLKGIDRRWENALCMVSGFVAAMLLGFNGYMWSQAVIVEVYPLSVLSLLITLCLLLRWMHAPEQKRYIYWAAFVFGICITNHQTLIVAAMGLEIAIIAAQPKLGRDLLIINCLAWSVGFLLKSNGTIHIFDRQDPRVANMVWVIFNLVGICSIVGLGFLWAKTKSLFTEWKAVLIMGFMWLVGACFYFYMPIASMTNPPMNWGYARTVGGFFHALSRGQYERTNPTNFIDNPILLWNQVIMYFQGAGDEFTWVYLLLALVPFFFFLRMQKREKAWMIGLFAIYACLAFLLLVLLNPAPDRAARDLVKVFFTASYVPLAIWIGYGLTLIGAYLLTQYERARFWVLGGAAVAIAVSLIRLHESITETFEIASASGAFSGLTTLFYGAKHLFEHSQGSLPIWGALIAFLLALSFFSLVFLWRKKVNLALVLVIFALMPTTSVVSHWANNEQRGHLFGFWFGHDMFTPPFTADDGKTPLYPEMARDAVLFGGTDPGRFCPTYMIFCESFIPAKDRRDPKFDRRDVCLITQNALADPTYLDYIRAHYNRSAQIDPPFFQNFLPQIIPGLVGTNPTPVLTKVDDFFTEVGARIEKNRRAGSSFFKPADFVNLTAFADKLRKSDHQDALSKFLRAQLSPETQTLLDGKANEASLKRALAKDLNVLLEKGSIYDAERFKNVKLPALITLSLERSPLPNTLIRLNRRMLEEAYPEIAKSPGGVYPDTEIFTPTSEDSQRSFDAYSQDLRKRAEHDQRFPDERKQLKQGEQVHVVDGRMQLSGQVSVMAINGLLTKIIFEKNPDREFYVEESFPLDWMYPYLTPSGIIMKINRKPLPELPASVIDTDHKFWSQYSTRLIGNWITYDTTVQELCTFAEKMYLHHDFKGFAGDRKFIRDDDAQKSFSKLRSSIGGVYDWRIQNSTSPAEKARAFKEAEFARKQAFAFCPYSPEAVWHYVELLMSMSRVDEAILVAKTCQKLDPNNASMAALVNQLEGIKGQTMAAKYNTVFAQVQQNLKASKTNEAIQALDHLLSQPDLDGSVLINLAQTYLSLRDYPKAEQAVLRLTKVAPKSGDVWYNLASVQAAQGKVAQAIQALNTALDLNAAELASNATTVNLRDYLNTDGNFAVIRQTPEFQALLKQRK